MSVSNWVKIRGSRMDDPRTISLGRFRITPHAGLVMLATAAFVGISVWWLLYDQRLPGGGDPGRHLSTVLGYGELLADFDLVGLLTAQPGGSGTVSDVFAPSPERGFFYPPLVRWIGAVPAALGLTVEDWGTIAINLIFVPMLASGCYLVGRLTYGRLAGMLAAIFALGAPMVLNLFHVFLIDAPLAGVIAITVWALLASDRFRDRRMSVLAGALAGVGLMVKTTAPIFLVGPVLVMLVGGGWRWWRNFALAGVALLVVAGPWHLLHLDAITNVSGQAPGGVAADVGGEAGIGVDFLDKLASYGWTAINLQYFLPLFALFAIGLVTAIRELRTRRHLPELLAGLLVAYLIFALAISLRDPRYTLPLVVFVSVLATGWIASSRRPVVRGAAVGVLVGAVLLNVAGSITNALPTARIHLPGDDSNLGDPTQPGALTLFDAIGYVVGAPRPDAFWQRLFDTAEREGVSTAKVRIRESPMVGADHTGFSVMARQRDIRETTFDESPGRPELLVDTWFTADSFWIEEKGLPPPCGTVPDGTALEGTDPNPLLSVAVQRRVDGRYERWCEF
jgi:hypothetical protein